jgi:cbb3-type cytochrome oxidase subunit 1
MIAATRVAVAAALLYFLVGNLLGLLLGTGVISHAWRPAHAHLNLLGFVAMMIYGVAYHALPRFRGVPLRRTGLALVQVILANVALVGMALSWGLVWPTWLFGVWGTLQLLASVLFVALLFEILWGRPPPRSGTPLPVR